MAVWGWKAGLGVGWWAGGCVCDGYGCGDDDGGLGSDVDDDANMN